MMRRLGGIGLALIVPVAILVGYALWSAQAGSFYFASLADIAREFRETWILTGLRRDLLPSLGRLLAGYLCSVVLGVLVGLLLGLSPLVRTAAEPVVEFLRALPPPALIPFALLIFGTADTGKVFVIVLGTIWPILLNTIDGVRGVESQQLDMARSFRVPYAARIRRIVLPAAAPRIAAGMRTSLSIAIILMVVSEMVASSNGVGYFVVQSQRSFAIPEMWSGIIVLGILGFVLNWLFVRVEDRLLFWHRGASGLLEPARLPSDRR